MSRTKLRAAYIAFNAAFLIAVQAATVGIGLAWSAGSLMHTGRTAIWVAAIGMTTAAGAAGVGTFRLGYANEMKIAAGDPPEV